MGQGLFILGTDTDAGKTFASAAVVYGLLQSGKTVAYYKPVQSGILNQDGTPAFTDTDFVATTTGLSPLQIHCSYGFKNPVSPHLAAEQEAIVIDRDLLIGTFRELQKTTDYVIVEGAGGIAVPIVRGQLTVSDLVRGLNIPALLVARAGVGTINHTVLTVAYAKSQGIDIKGIIINNFTGKPHEKDNIRVIEDMTGLPVVSVLSHIEARDTQDFLAQCPTEYAKNLATEKIIGLLPGSKEEGVK